MGVLVHANRLPVDIVSSLQRKVWRFRVARVVQVCGHQDEAAAVTHAFPQRTEMMVSFAEPTMRKCR